MSIFQQYVKCLQNTSDKCNCLSKLAMYSYNGLSTKYEASGLKCSFKYTEQDYLTKTNAAVTVDEDVVTLSLIKNGYVTPTKN